MAEPRMRPRQKGQQFATSELEAFLYAFGDDPAPLSSTVALLDELVSDFIIETCHAASTAAAYSHRSKIKVDDFKWMLRRDPKKLGRVTELLAKNREMVENRKVFNENEQGLIEEGKKGKRGRKSKEEKARLAKEEGEDAGGEED